MAKKEKLRIFSIAGLQLIRQCVGKGLLENRHWMHPGCVCLHGPSCDTVFIPMTKYDHMHTFCTNA